MKLVSYYDILKNIKKENSKCYKCNICNQIKYDIWLEYLKDNNKSLKICGYSCSAKYFKDKPFYLKYTVNKKDFDFPRPVTKLETKKFEILSEYEIDLLSDYEYINYHKDLDNYILLNPERAKLQLDIQNNNNYVDRLLSEELV